jgi:hypothetical protein
MKNSLFLLSVVTVLALASCSDLDKEGRLPIEKLTSSSGSLKFFAMLHSDSASVLNFVADTFLYKGEPYTGAVAQYENDTLAIISGFLKNGLMDSVWTFRYKSGGVRMEGSMKNGLEVGLWKSYYGYSKPKIDKLYDDNGFMLMRVEYYDNGRVNNYQNIKCAQYGDQERRVTFTPKGAVLSIVAEDAAKVFSSEELSEKIKQNGFMLP